jgi:ABC-type transporter Mla subunit MlaD
MALQDLTPQLRTRLSRMERAVGWFVFLATALLLFGFGYYVYHTAERKGWFVIKARFHTYVKSSSGLTVGDPVYMMGFPVGQIILIHAMPPRDPHNVRVEFDVRDPYFRYIWSGGSYVKVNAAGFLSQRQLEVTRATNGYAIVVTQPVTDFTNLDELAQNVAAAPGEWQLSQDVFDAASNIVFHAYDILTPSNLPAVAALSPGSIYAYNNTVNRNRIVASWDGRYHHYKIFTPADDTAWLRAVEAPPVSDQLQAMVTQVQQALPGILALTNKIATVLDNTALATSNLNLTVAEARPMLTNCTVISGQLREPGGPLLWALGSDGSGQVQGALTNVNALLTNTDTNLTALLLNLSDITSNLNAQVQANSNLLSGISKTVVDADGFVQGLKHHWLLRSAFRTRNTNAPAASVEPLLPPRMR